MTTQTTAPHPSIAKVLLDEERLKARIRELGEQITRDYAGRDLLMVGILKGCVVFMGELMKHVSLDCDVDFMSVSSYAGTKSTGVVATLLDLSESPEGRDVLLIEDIVDTGLTLRYLLENLKTRRPKTLEVCVMLDKPECRKAPVKAKYVGFQMPNEFLVGFGLDYNQKYRNLPYVGVMRQPKANGK